VVGAWSVRGRAQYGLGRQAPFGAVFVRTKKKLCAGSYVFVGAQKKLRMGSFKIAAIPAKLKKSPLA